MRISKILRVLMTAAVVVVALEVPDAFSGGGGRLRERIQQKLSTQSNIQYEPYYLETSYEVQRDDAQVQQEYWGNDKPVQQPAAQNAAPQAPVRRAAGGFQQSNYAPQVSVAEAAVVPALAAPAPSVPAISSYVVYQTNYNAELEENVVTVTGKVVFEVFTKKGWTQIPLVKSDVGLIDVRVNKGASFVTMQGGKYFLMIDKPGRYNLEFEFLIKSSREREGGPGNFSVEVIPAPISQFEFSIPEDEVQIFVEPAIKTEIKKDPGKTSAWAVMPNTSSVSVRWSRALPKEEIQPVKLEPKVYADSATYVAVGEGIMRSTVTVNYSILQAELSALRLALPEDVSVLEVNGNELRDWKVSTKEGTQYLDVFLNYGIKGNYILTISHERSIGEGSVVAEIPWVKALGVERETGYFGIAARTNVELAAKTLDHVNLIDVKELPSTIWSSSSNPILLAFKYLNHPFSIQIEVTKHEELPVLVAAIDAAEYVSLHTQEGKLLTKATYRVRNNVKQFLHLGLPKGATLWSSFVAGKPVKPAKDKNGSVLIPLEKSQLQGESLSGFPVEIVYLENGPSMGFSGALDFALPKTDIPVSQLNWTVYLPNEYAYFGFKGDVKPVETFSSWGFSSAVQGRLKSATDDIGEQFSAGQTRMYSKSEPVQLNKGALPIRIDVPQFGRGLRFTKLLVTEQESPKLKFSYLNVAKKFKTLLRLTVLALIVVLLFVLVRRVFFKKP